MKKKSYMDVLVPVLMFLAIAFSIYIAYFRQTIETDSSTSVEMTYETSLFDDSKVQSVNIIMDESSWQEMIDNAMSEEFYACDIIINGVTYKNVGIRPKGNTSLTMIASDNTTDRYSFKIDFGKYIDGQTCDGLDVLVLNNLMSDATYMKEYLAYDLFKFMDVDASLTAFTEVKVNGEDWGLYLAIEGVEESFAQREYGYTHGKLYKPESDSVEGGGGGEMGFGSSSAGADLSYIDDEADSYSDIFNNAVFDVDSADQKAVIEALKNINDGTELEKYIDVDQMLRYIAVNVVVVNLDSYFGTMLHNYYLYEEDGQLTMVPWDYNLAFAGFQSSSSDSAVNLAIDTVVSGAKLEDRPMIAKLLEVEEYREKYYEYLQQIVTEYFESGYFAGKIENVDSMISPYVEKDATAFYSYDEYKTAVDTLLTFGILRSQSIQGQLDGTIPSTEEGQRADDTNLVDASGINLSDMGTMGGGDNAGGRGRDNVGGKGGGNGGGRGENNGSERGEGMPQMPDGMENDTGGRPEGMTMGESNEAPQRPEKQQDNVPVANMGQMPKENMSPGNRENTGISQHSTKDWVVAGISVVLLVSALIFVKNFKRKKYSAK